MSKFLPILLFSLIGLVSNGQILSKFTWDAEPVTLPVIGPNAISVSPTAFAGVGGVLVSNGLNAGTPTNDVNLTLPNLPDFNVAGLDFQTDYQMDEPNGFFLWRTGFSFGINDQELSVSFTLSDGLGGSTTINSGDIYNVPDDDVFRTYRFFYLSTSGQAMVLVNSTIVYSYNGVPNRNMVWTNDSFIIAYEMDGNADNKVFMDNVILGGVFNSPLPVTLMGFQAEHSEEGQVLLTWKTATETNNDRFEIERSFDGINWPKLSSVSGAGNSFEPISYAFRDSNPISGTAYYRLVQVDFDGYSTISPIASVNYVVPTVEAKLFPNPCINLLNIQTSKEQSEPPSLFNIQGVLLEAEASYNQQSKSYVLQIDHLPPGSYFVKSGDKYLSFKKK